MICTRLHPGRLSVCIGDSPRPSEKIVKKSQIVPFSAIIINRVETFAFTTDTQCHTMLYCTMLYYTVLEYSSMAWTKTAKDRESWRSLVEGYFLQQEDTA